MACEHLACVGVNGCIETFPSGEVGQILMINAFGEPTWVSLADLFLISDDPNNCLESRADGLFVPCVDVLQDEGYIAHTDANSYTAPSGIVTPQSENVVISNPSTTQDMYVHITSSGSMEIDNITGISNVNVSHRIVVDGSTVAAAIGENSQAGDEYGWSGSASTEVVIPPGGSISVDFENRLSLPSSPTTAGPVHSRINYSWQAILVEA